MKKSPLVSVIITTKNEEANIRMCLESIRKQSYKNIEIIVVDNGSSDRTKEIAFEYTKKVFDKGPERSTQRNYGAFISKGDYLIFLDADMVVTPEVLEECIKTIRENKVILGLVIPEKSFGSGFWAACKALERSFYLGVDWLEGARFYNRNIFKKMKGYDEKNTGTEDYDLPQRIKNTYSPQSIGRIKSYILHNEGNLSLIKTMKKKYYYAQKLDRYKSQTANSQSFKTQASILSRYKLFFSDPAKLVKNPMVGFGMLCMKTCEFAAGGLGYLKSKL